ncbi:hypothetical protein N665_0290s0044 [Sinapis alba]|nr:hypothetical protein N665_0290s0044 [Sinapis alba]
MKEKSKDEALKKKPSSPKRVGKSLKKKRGTLYIIVKCITMLLCSNE